MKKVFIIIFTAFLSILLVGCSTASTIKETEQSAIPTVNTKTDEQEVVSQFASVVAAVNSDESGIFSNIKFGTPAHSAIVEIEKIYNRNKSNEIITEIYYYCEVISCINVYGIMENQKYYDQAVVYAKQIDKNYSGPYASEIIALANKYGGGVSAENTKTALTMNYDEKADLKWWIEQRYNYYDIINGGYTANKYSEIIFQETAYVYGITITDVDMIWSDSSVAAQQSSAIYRKNNANPYQVLTIETDYNNIRVGISPDWEPFEYIDSEGDLDGFEVAIAKLIASYNNFNITFVIVNSFDTLLVGLDIGQYDFVMSGMDLTTERAEKYGHSNVYFHYNLGGYVENIVAYTRKSDLRLVEILNNTFPLIKATDEYKTLKEKYGVETLNGAFSD